LRVRLGLVAQFGVKLRQQQVRIDVVGVDLKCPLEPLDRDAFAAAIDHAFKAAGATDKVLSDPALEMLFRASRGVLRVAARLLRAALRIAHERGQGFLDEPTLQAALDEVGTT